MLPQANKWRNERNKEAVPELKSITVYPCPYCGRLHKTVKGATSHQAQCYRNPARRACVTCRLFGAINREQYGYWGCVMGYDKVYLEGYEQPVMTHDCDWWEPKEVKGE